MTRPNWIKLVLVAGSDDVYQMNQCSSDRRSLNRPVPTMDSIFTYQNDKFNYLVIVGFGVLFLIYFPLIFHRIKLIGNTCLHVLLNRSKRFLYYRIFIILNNHKHAFAQYQTNEHVFQKILISSH